MNRRPIHAMLIGWVLALVVGCDEFSLDTYWRDGNYRLIAIDARGQMCLQHPKVTTADVVAPTVFSIGADERFIVVAQHPSTNAFGDFNRSITRYFVVERMRSSTLADQPKAVRGPLSK